MDYFPNWTGTEDKHIEPGAQWHSLNIGKLSISSHSEIKSLLEQGTVGGQTFNS